MKEKIKIKLTCKIDETSFGTERKVGGMKGADWRLSVSMLDFITVNIIFMAAFG